MKRKRTTQAREGFTLMETMIIVVIIGIIAGLTIPAFMGYFQRQKLIGVQRELMSDIAFARSLAIARRSTFRIDFNANNYQVVDPGNGDQIMRQRQMPDGIILNADTNPNFYAHGLADAATIVIDGSWDDNNVQLLPNGTATHD
jgi:type IV fimbrial biogenesis protein FimT